MLVLRAGPSRRLAPREDVSGASPAERAWNAGVRDLPPYGRVALARVLLGSAGAGLETGVASGRGASPAERAWNAGVRDRAPRGRAALARVLMGSAEAGVASPPGRPWDRRPVPVAPVPARSAVAGVLTSTADGGRAENTMTPGPDHAEARTTLTASVVAGEDPRVLMPTRVMSDRPATCPSGETAHRLGETTDSLLLRHLRTRPAKDASPPPEPIGTARPPMLDAPSTITEIPRRERRLLPGRQAGDSTPRTR
ncbi:hypothetical protein GCM10027176_88100 [Actinoallomurus bryophytorum]